MTELEVQGVTPFDFNRKTQIMTETTSYARCYPVIVELANRQLEKQFWTSSEMKVELDRMQLLYELTPAQLHAVKFVLQLFLKYELIVGEEFWNSLIIKLFPRPECKLAASILGAIELGVHAEFYNQINVQLGLDKDEDYIAYASDPILSARVAWLEEILSGEDKLLAAIIFGLTETALLFSSFSILKSFQSNGYNKIPVIVRGTNQSAVDEDLHGVIAAEMINTHYAELGKPLIEDTRRVEEINRACHFAYEHESRIIDLAILEDTLNGVKKQEYKEMVKHRINVFRERLGLPHMFTIGECSIIDWFESNTYAYKVVDFFTPGLGMEYETAWDETAFIRGYKEAKSD